VRFGMLGVGYPLGKSFAVDATYAHIFTPGRRRPPDERAPGSTRRRRDCAHNGATR